MVATTSNISDWVFLLVVSSPVVAMVTILMHLISYFISSLINVVTNRLKNYCKRKIVGITSPYIDIINAQGFDNKFARFIDDG